ncbi:hypothetical protein BC629DRAFT_9551 [Irpex lacteus]|nr:hypothetical protein BC629DRAFT_9551 [Irpex lacteus]
MTRIAVATLLVILASNVAAAPTFHKRIAQTISASTQKWEASCLAAGGADKCNPLSIKAFSTLLAAAGPCEQQDAADEMIDLAKTLNNNTDMINFTQIFVQQPRNSPNSVAIPYCQNAPRNVELNGLYQCQFQGSDQTTFAGNLKLGANGTIPFGMTSALSPAGSCPANPSGPIADGTQLVDQVSSPGTVGSGTSNTTTSATSATDSFTVSATIFTSSASSVIATPTASLVGTGADGGQCANTGENTASSASPSIDSVATATSSDFRTTSIFATATDAGSVITSVGTGITSSVPASVATSVTPSASASAGGDGTSSEDFHLKNGQDAQALNAKFSALTADSSCNAGDQVCVDGGFAQCVSGKLVATQCAGGTSCFALPLVNKPGTSIACTTEDDAAARIQATGAEGGITGQ